jgi:chaperonin GroEL
LEGCGFEVRWAIDELRGSGLPVTELWIAGGAAASPVWPKILADIGEFGRLEIRPGQTPELRREQVEGHYWERGLMSRRMAPDQHLLRADFADAAVLISDLEIDDVRQLMAPMELASNSGVRCLFIVAQKLSDSVIGFLLANVDTARFRAIAVTTPGYGLDQIGELEDLAVVTGGRPILKVTAETLDHIRLQDLGRAGRMWADIHNFGVIDGTADPAAVERHLLSLFSAFERADDPVLREKLRKRIARIQGDSVTLWVGGDRPDAIKARTDLAERTAGMIREALMYGVTAGGGAALLGCRPALRRLLADSSEADARAAYQILLRAVERPMRVIASNAGYDPEAVLAQVEQTGPGYGLDATTGQVVAMTQAGILDVASVLKSAVSSAVSSAALALTVEVMVQHRMPEQGQAVPPMATKRL